MTAESNHDDELILALASGASWRRAATAVGISPATVGRRLANDDFRRRVTERRAELLDAASGHLVATMRLAAVTLRKLLKSDSDAVKLGAAKCALDLAMSVRAAVDFEKRLLDLEARSQ